jgi:hypothetical protein
VTTTKTCYSSGATHPGKSATSVFVINGAGMTQKIAAKLGCSLYGRCMADGSVVCGGKIRKQC